MVDNTELIKEQEKLKDNVLSRLKRIEGQVRGIQRMINEGKECRDILVQMRAVHSALQSTNTQILKRYMIKCHADAISEDENGRYEKLEELIKVLANFLDG